MAVAMAVREFVAPLEPTGSLGPGQAPVYEEDAPALGARLHQRTQKRLLQECPGSQCEVAVQLTLERPGFTCLVRGRLDVLLATEPETVEEIKTSFRPGAVLQGVAATDHPFALQARMYAWLRWRQTGVAPLCRLRVLGLLDETEVLVDLPFDPEAFTAWVEARLEALHGAFLRAQARTAERRELGTRLAFPFPEPRPGQAQLVATVTAALDEGRRLVLQAPTGLGKTAAMLFPALARALAEDLRVFYLTPRNSQHEVAEDCVRRLGPGVRSVTIRAKERVCTQPEVDCRPEVCPRSKDYFDRLRASGALDAVAGLGCATSAALAQVADAHCLCPFELSLDAARHADVVIGDYNYGFAPNASLHRFFGTPEACAQAILLVDEAHNLPGRAAEWFSPALDLAWLQELRKQRLSPPNRGLRTKLTAQLKRCGALLETLVGEHREVQLEDALFYAEEFRMGRLLAAAAAAGQELPGAHPLVALYRGWSGFCEVLRLRTEAHALTWIPPGRLQITCADASDHLATRMAAVANAVLFSGTLKPFDFTRRLTGLADLPTAWAEVPSPFPAAHRKVLVVPQLSTRYRQRDRAVPRLAQFLQRVLPLRLGNYFVFFPSFQMLEQTRPHLDLPGFTILAQPRRATADQLRSLLEALRGQQGVVVLAVQGGSLSEGIDYPGDALIGCVVVGPPLPPFDLEREHIRRHFQKRYGCGQAYAYIYPACAKAVQAAGRVIRTPEDRGLLIFLDDRFLDPDYAACFPEGWFRDSVRELVSTGILAEVQDFWNQGLNRDPK